MTKDLDISNLETINVGIVGHIDHGKTTLLQKLSGKWADTHSEELKRGITIKLGYADAIIKKEKDKYTVNPESGATPIKYITFVDAPGHEMLMATMLSGAAIMDAAILVVAANEGIKPQTREHLIALKAKNIKNIIIIQNKIDLVTKEQAIENYNHIKEFTKGTIAENAQVIPTAALQEINLDKVLQALVNIQTDKSKIDKDPVFLVARSFDINKPGTKITNLKGGVLGGALKQGTIKIGDIIEIKPGYSYKKQNEQRYQTLQTKVTSIQKGIYKVESATVGGSLAIETELDPTLTKADALSGCIAGGVDKLPEITTTLKIEYELFSQALGNETTTITAIKPNELLMLSIDTSITVGQVSKVSSKELTVNLKIPVVPLKNNSLGIARNINGHWRLIGFGTIQ